jgi:hypothetical protein
MSRFAIRFGQLFSRPVVSRSHLRDGRKNEKGKEERHSVRGPGGKGDEKITQTSAPATKTINLQAKNYR